MCCNCSSSVFIGALSISCLLLASLFSVVAFSSNYWLTGTSNDKTRNITNYEFGLWTTCYNEFQKPLLATSSAASVQQLVDNNQTMTANVTSSTRAAVTTAVTTPVTVAPTRTSTLVYVCDSTHSWVYSQNNGWQDSWLEGFQVVVTIALVLTLASSVGAIVFNCCSYCWTRKRYVGLAITYLTTIASYSTACLLMLGLIICGAKPFQDDTVVTGAALSWCFYLAVVADFLLWFASGVTFARFSLDIQTYDRRSGQ